MQTSQQGLDLIIGREGNKLVAYRDTKGIWTIGVGHTTAAGPPAVHPGMTITAEQEREILSRDIVKAENYVNTAVKVPLAQHEFDALVSIMDNCGPAFCSSSAIRLLNKGDRVGAANAIMMWDKPPEVVSRRRGEQAQFNGTSYQARIT